MSPYKPVRPSVPLSDEKLTPAQLLELLRAMEERVKEEQAGSLRKKITQMRTRGERGP